jgi:mevalonate kinase
MKADSATPRSVLASAPGKVILFGEHAINRGQPAIATAVGIYARCRATLRPGAGITLRSGTREELTTHAALIALAARVDASLLRADYASIEQIVAQDYWAPAKYVLAAALAHGLPAGLEITWTSDLPPSSGIGSGGAAFTALVAAVSGTLLDPPTAEVRVRWAHRGDIVAHGGIASTLDTQTSLTGGVIRLTQETPGRYMVEPLQCAPGLRLVIGNTGVIAATSAINGRVRQWLAEQPGRPMAYFEAVGTLSRTAIPLLERGEWGEVGRLFTLNQLILEQIGVSCPQLEALIDGALEAGASGAKLSGSGGGGIMIALASPETEHAVAQAITAAGGVALTPAVGVPGVQTSSN